MKEFIEIITAGRETSIDNATQFFKRLEMVSRKESDKINRTFTPDQIAEMQEVFNLFPQDSHKTIDSSSVEALLKSLGYHPHKVGIRTTFMAIIVQINE